MDAPLSSAHHRRPDHSSGTIRKSPPGSLAGSLRGMINPPNPFAAMPQASRTPGLAPSLPQPEIRSPGGYNSTSYSHSTSPSTASGSIPEISAHDQPSLVISATQLSSTNLSTQKRAYRQRRKDPSCDACRERKVKCDATETTACSECSSRNHKCQFTKDTNRRMSSIKQVQDLQSQIAELQQQLTRVGGQDNMELDAALSRDTRAQRPQLPATARRAPTPTLENFDHVRSNIHIHSAGIFQTPRPYLYSRPADPAAGYPEIPPRAQFAQISRSYLDAIHEAYPVLHWPTFQKEVDQVYTARTFQGMSREWIGMYFAVLACGSLNLTATAPYGNSDGTEFYDIASQAITRWPEDPTIVHVRLLFLLGLYATENNAKCSGSMWLTCASRAAQLLSLHRQDTTQPAFEVEMRRRLWWAIYVQDRLTSFGANLPFTINEDDCDDSLPSSIEDGYIGSPNVPYPQQTPSHGFVAMIRIARLFSDMHQTLQSDSITQQALSTHEEQFRTMLTQLPGAYQPDSDTRLNAWALLPTITLHLARFQLCRRNLTPTCPPSDRGAALTKCTTVALDTAKYIQSALQTLDRMKNVASNLICVHLWRCILILCLRGEYQAALVCVGASAAIGEVRKINTACGKNTVFFLEQLTERIRRGDGNLSQLASDEEMLAYASGDLQSSSERSWAWAGATETAAATCPHATAQSGVDSVRTNEWIQGTLPLRPNPNAADTGARQWAGWGGVEYMIKMLMGRQKRMAPAPTNYPPPHNPVKRVQLAPDAPKAATTSSNASRISIANII